MYQVYHNNLSIWSYYLHKYGKLGDLILEERSLTSLKQSLVKLRRLIGSTTIIQVLYGVTELM